MICLADEIVVEACRQGDVTLAEVMGTDAHAHVARVRYRMIYVILAITGMTQRAAAEHLRMHKGTMWKGANQIAALIRSDPDEIAATQRLMEVFLERAR